MIDDHFCVKKKTIISQIVDPMGLEILKRHQTDERETGTPRKNKQKSTQKKRKKQKWKFLNANNAITAHVPNLIVPETCQI